MCVSACVRVWRTVCMRVCMRAWTRVCAHVQGCKVRTPPGPQARTCRQKLMASVASWKAQTKESPSFLHAYMRACVCACGRVCGRACPHARVHTQQGVRGCPGRRTPHARSHLISCPPCSSIRSRMIVLCMSTAHAITAGFHSHSAVECAMSVSQGRAGQGGRGHPSQIHQAWPAGHVHECAPLIATCCI